MIYLWFSCYFWYSWDFFHIIAITSAGVWLAQVDDGFALVVDQLIVVLLVR